MINAIRDCATSAYYTVESICSKTTTLATALFKVISSPKAKIYTTLALGVAVSVILPVAAAAKTANGEEVWDGKWRVVRPCCGNDFFDNVMIVIARFVFNKTDPIRDRVPTIYDYNKWHFDLVIAHDNKSNCELALLKEIETVFDSSVPAARQFAEQCLMDNDRMPQLELIHGHCQFNNTALIEKLYEDNIHLRLTNVTWRASEW